MTTKEIQHSNADLTLGILLCSLHSVTKSFYRNQSALFSALFNSYCKFRGGEEYPDWVPSQGSISKIFCGKERPSRYLLNYYLAHGDTRLREDCYQFVKNAAPTARHYKLILSMITDLVDASTNLDPDDKRRLKDFALIDQSNPLPELLFRVLQLLMQYA